MEKSGIKKERKFKKENLGTFYYGKNLRPNGSHIITVEMSDAVGSLFGWYDQQERSQQFQSTSF